MQLGATQQQWHATACTAEQVAAAGKAVRHRRWQQGMWLAGPEVLSGSASSSRQRCQAPVYRQIVDDMVCSGGE